MFKITIPSALKKEIVSTLIGFAIDLLRRFIFSKKKAPEVTMLKTPEVEPAQPAVCPKQKACNNRRNTKARRVQFVDGKRIVHSK